MPKVLKKLKNGPVIEVDAQIILWRRRRLKAGLRANGTPITKDRRKELNDRRPRVDDTKLRNIFSFDDKE